MNGIWYRRRDDHFYGYKFEVSPWSWIYIYIHHSKKVVKKKTFNKNVTNEQEK